MHNNIERERAYIFSIEAGIDLAKKLGIDILNKCREEINDCYINKNLRIRNEYKLFFVQRKTGDKSTLSRTEESSMSNKDVFDILKKESKLEIKKQRIRLIDNPEYLVTMDILDKPFKICIIEIESRIDKDPPKLEEILKDKNGREFIECPLSIWDYCHRKIGICGGPSAGKSEMSKFISHNLVSHYNINAFSTTEYCTSFIQKYKREPTVHDQFIIWHSQNKREKDAQNKHGIVLSDSPTFLSYIYSLYYCRNNPIEDNSVYLLLSKLYKRCLEDIKDYEQIILLDTLGYEDNGVRYHNKEESIKIKLHIKKFLEDHRIKFIESDYRKKQELVNKILYLN